MEQILSEIMEDVSYKPKILLHFYLPFQFWPTDQIIKFKFLIHQQKMFHSTKKQQNRWAYMVAIDVLRNARHNGNRGRLAGVGLAGYGRHSSLRLWRARGLYNLLHGLGIHLQNKLNIYIRNW